MGRREELGEMKAEGFRDRPRDTKKGEETERHSEAAECGIREESRRKGGPPGSRGRARRGGSRPSGGWAGRRAGRR